MNFISKSFYSRPALMASLGAVAGLILAQASFGQEYIFEPWPQGTQATGEITVGAGGIITAGEFQVLAGAGVPGTPEISLVGDTFTLYPGGEPFGYAGPLPDGYVFLSTQGDPFGNGLGLGQEIGPDGDFYAQGGAQFFGGNSDHQAQAAPLEGNWMQVPDASQTALLLALSVAGLGVASRRFKSASV